MDILVKSADILTKVIDQLGKKQAIHETTQIRVSTVTCLYSLPRALRKFRVARTLGVSYNLSV